jgi:hypothetical protein
MLKRILEPRALAGAAVFREEAGGHFVAFFAELDQQFALGMGEMVGDFVGHFLSPAPASAHGRGGLNFGCFWLGFFFCGGCHHCGQEIAYQVTHEVFEFGG